MENENLGSKLVAKGNETGKRWETLGKRHLQGERLFGTVVFGRFFAIPSHIDLTTLASRHLKAPPKFDMIAHRPPQTLP